MNLWRRPEHVLDQKLVRADTNRLRSSPDRAQDPGQMPDLMPLRFLLATVAGFVNREQAKTIAYLVEENRVLREQIVERRMRLNDDQRRRLAAMGRLLGRRLLGQVATIVTPDTSSAGTAN